MFTALVSIKHGKDKTKKRTAVVRFHRPDDLTTLCHLGLTDDPKGEPEFIFEGKARRLRTDPYDKVKGHIVALKHALAEAKITCKNRRQVYAEYADWVLQNNVFSSKYTRKPRFYYGLWFSH